MIFTPLESPVSQLSNEVKHVENGAVDLEICPFEAGRQENLENCFQNPRCPPVVNRKSAHTYFITWHAYRWTTGGPKLLPLVDGKLGSRKVFAVRACCALRGVRGECYQNSLCAPRCEQHVN